MSSTAHILLPLLRAAMSGESTEREINSLVRIAHRFALIRLKQLAHSGKLHLHSFPLSLDAAAFDCVAELFQRDEEGRFSELKEYFSDSRDIQTLSAEDALRHFRGMVFTKLNDGIFRLYRENDPILSKILRNVKIAIQRDPMFRCFDRFNQTYIFRCDEDERNNQLPEYPLEEFESALMAQIAENNGARPYLKAMFDVLNNQNDYRKFYSLINAAILIKRAITRMQTPLEEVFTMDDSLLQADISSIVGSSVRSMKDSLKLRFVQSNKMNEDIFEKYFSAVEEIIYDTFVNNDGTIKSQSDYLRRHCPEITYEEYRTTHRMQFEYMAKLTKKSVQEKLRELL